MKRIDRFHNVIDVAELPGPDREHGLLYIVRGDVFGTMRPVHVGYLCPCGCGEPVNLPLVGDAWHCATEPDGEGVLYTFSPSVRMADPNGCQSHYWVRRNRIEWV